MGSRLVLGTGPIGRAVLEHARDREWGVRVVTDHPDTIEMLIDTDLVVPGDPSDPATLRSVPGPVDVVFVGEGDPDRAAAIARLAGTVFDGVPIVAVDDPGASAEARRRLEATADVVIDPTATVVAGLVDRAASEPAGRAFHLRRVLLDVDGSLCVVTHDNPDPDAIASGLALARIAERYGIEAETCYFGDITHQQNRALVNLLGLPLRNLDDPAAIESYDAVALVDHAMPGVNDQLPEDTPVAIVIDHHPARVTADAAHLDLRSDAGSSSTLLVEYLSHLEVEPDDALATALLFGIQTDTHDFTHGVSTLDYRAAARLLPAADPDILERVEAPTMSAETLDTMARAIRNARIRRGIATSCLGRIRDRDALAQAADRLVNMDDVRAALVYGFADGTIYLSARSSSGGLDIGETIRDAFDQIGNAGGHPRMAGAQIPLGILGHGDGVDESDLTSIVREVVDERFFETVADRRTPDRRIDGPESDPPGPAGRYGAGE